MAGRIKNREKENKLPYTVIGHIACGEKTEKGYPRALDHFVCNGGKYKPLFDKVYGNNSSTIHIVFPSDDASLVCNEFYELRDNAGKTIADGDGETFRVWSEKTKTYTKLTTEQYPDLMNMIKSRYPNSGDWKVTLKLVFSILEIRGVMGFWSFTTKGSASTIPQVRDTFDAMLEQNGFVKGVLFDLNVKIHKSNKPNDSSRYPVVSLVPNESEEMLRLANECRKPIMIEG